MALPTNLDTFVANINHQGGSQDTAKVVKLTGGGFAVVWQDTQSGDADVKFQRFDGNGNTVGAIQGVTTNTTGNQTLSDVISLDNGGFTVAWVTDNEDDYTANVNVDEVVVTRSFSANGTGQTEFGHFVIGAPPRTVTGEAQLLKDGANSYIVAWAESDGTNSLIRTRAVDFNANGGAIQTIDTIAGITHEVLDIAEGSSASNQLILVSDTGNNLAFFSDNVASKLDVNDLASIVGIAPGLYASTSAQFARVQMVGISGAGNAAAAYTITTAGLSQGPNDGSGASVIGSDILDLGNGRVLVTWAADTGTGIDQDGIFAAVYNIASGVFEGSTTRIDTVFTPTAANLPDAELLPDGRVLISWSKANGIAGPDAFAKIVDPRIEAINIIGSTGADVIVGTAFNDTIRGLAGADTLDGGAGSGDIVSYFSLGTAVKVDLINSSLNTGEAALDTLAGFEGVIGSIVNDTLYGTQGANFIDGQDGLDFIAGRDGNDTLNGGAGNDNINAGAGDDSVTGGIGNDVIAGKIGNDIIDGGQGVDAVSGGAGNDILLGGAGNDRLQGNAGDDELEGGANDDSLVGGEGEDALSGGDGNDKLVGLAGDDQLDGGDGDDLLLGGDGSDVVSGGAGSDTISFVALTVLINGVIVDLDGGSNGDGIADTDDGNTDLLTDIENVIGSRLDDLILGSAVVNRLEGGDGDDLLVGEGDADVLVGGLGDDSFRFETTADGGATGDAILDYLVGTDVFEVRGSAFGLAIGSSVAVENNASGQATVGGTRFILDTAGAGAGGLFFDADGSGAGLRVKLAQITFSGATTLSSADFDVI